MAKRASRNKSSDESPAATPVRPARASRAKAPAAPTPAPASADDTPSAAASDMAPSEAFLDAPPPATIEPAGNGKTTVSMSSEPSEADIRLRAYHKFLHRDGGHGSEFDDWIRAERELRRKSDSDKRQLS